MLNASITDLVFVLKTPTTAADVNAMLKAASEEGPLAASAEHGDILGYETQPLVSTDYVNDVRSSIVDASSTMMVGDKMLKIYAWYDNEAGYSMRKAELARLVVRSSSKKVEVSTRTCVCACVAAMGAVCVSICLNWVPNVVVADRFCSRALFEQRTGHARGIWALGLHAGRGGQRSCRELKRRS